MALQEHSREKAVQGCQSCTSLGANQNAMSSAVCASQTASAQQACSPFFPTHSDGAPASNSLQRKGQEFSLCWGHWMKRAIWWDLINNQSALLNLTGKHSLWWNADGPRQWTQNSGCSKPFLAAPRAKGIHSIPPCVLELSQPSLWKLWSKEKVN